jgi:hypothetical protein
MHPLAKAIMLAALAAAPFGAKADELSDLKAQLDAAQKAIQALQHRVESLEAEKNKQAAAPAVAPAPAPATAPLPEKTEVAGAPVVAPNQHVSFPVPGTADGRLEIYGQAMLDAIYDAKTVDPLWAATLRPSTIPVNCPPDGNDAGCGKHGITTFSARQSTFGVKGFFPTDHGDIKTQFEFDLFGSGADAGRTAFRLKQAWGSWGAFLGGYTNTLFMDADVFPNTIDFWGPTGMIYLLDPQLRWTIHDADGTKFAVAFEVPGDAIDIGKVANLLPELSLETKAKYPDITAQWRLDGDWGHVQVAAVARWISYDNPATPNFRPANTLFGGGGNFSGRFNFGEDALMAQFAYGRGIASFSNDCCYDLGPNEQLRAKTLPLFDWLVYYDHYWSDKWSSSIGYSQNTQTNSAGQFDTEQHRGSYASVNLLYKPLQNVLVGAEVLWGERENKDGKTGSDDRIQFSTKVSF